MSLYEGYPDVCQDITLSHKFQYTFSYMNIHQMLKLHPNKHNQSMHGHSKFTTAHFSRCVLNVIKRDNLLADFIAFWNRIYK